MLGQVVTEAVGRAPVPRQGCIYWPAVVYLVQIVQDDPVGICIRLSPGHVGVYVQVEILCLGRTFALAPDKPVVTVVQ